MSDNAIRIGLAQRLWGWEPHDTQRQWLRCDVKTKVAACGRRWGKTEAAAVDAATAAILRPGFVQIIVSPTYDQSRLIFQTVERLMLSSHVTRHGTKVVRTPYPRLTFGKSLVMARTADEDGRNLRGHSADRVIIDEAAYVRDSVVREVISPMLADRDGELVMLSTPFGKNHFYQAFVRGEKQSDEDCASFTFPSWENPHISRDYIERQRHEMSSRQFSVEYEARFLDDQSCVFSWDEIGAAVERGGLDEVLDPGFGCRATQTTRDERVVVGIDWARYSDYTALVALKVCEQGVAVVGLDRFNGIGWSSQIERAVEFVSAHHASAVLVDQTSIGDPLLEQLRSKLWETGIDIVVDGFNFTNQSKRELVNHLALRFTHGEIAIPRDEHLISELQYFEYEITQSGNIRLNAHTGYHDDMVIALALACRQARGLECAGGYLSRDRSIEAVGW